jgi:hypothetical protein
MHPVALLSKLSHHLIGVKIGLYGTRAQVLSDETDFSNSCNVSACRPQTR